MAAGKGFLSVQVLFNRRPLAGLQVGFLKAGKDETVGNAATDASGVAKLSPVFDIGNYDCLIENEPKTKVTTVEDPSEPFVIHLPVGRVYYQLTASVPAKYPADNPVLAADEEAGLPVLAVQVLFNGEPAAGLSVSFSKTGEDSPLGTVVTAANGIAKLGSNYEPGNYLCRVESEPPVTVSTVEDPSAPFVLYLPAGRPYMELSHSVPAVYPADNPALPELEYSQSFLSVQVLFNGSPMPDLNVTFFSGAEADPIGSAVTSSNGVAALEGEREPGAYRCQVEAEPTTTITTVDDAADPFVLRLPAGRPYIEVVHSLPAEYPVDQPVLLEMVEPAASYLSVQVLFNGNPLPGLAVKFFKPGEGVPLGIAQTASNGIATLDPGYDPGNYECQVEAEPRMLVSTVETASSPYTIDLPAGRPAMEVVHSVPAQYPKDQPVYAELLQQAGFLSVQVVFDGRPVPGLGLEFYRRVEGDRPADLIGSAVTEANGVAGLSAELPTGNYWCRIEGEPLMMLSTVEDRGSPLTLRLPTGRPLLGMTYSAPADYPADNPVFLDEEARPEDDAQN